MCAPSPQASSQTSAAIETISSSLAFCSSSVRSLPSKVEEKPHCGLRQSCSIGANLAAASIRRRMSSRDSSLPCLVVLGLITTKQGKHESRDDILRRIEAAAKFAPLDQLCLSPQCGFSSTFQGNDLTEDEQKAKLELIVSIAAEVWDDA